MQGVDLVRLITIIICLTNILGLIFYLVSLLNLHNEMLKSIKCLKMLPSKVIIDYDAIKVRLKSWF